MAFAQPHLSSRARLSLPAWPGLPASVAVGSIVVVAALLLGVATALQPSMMLRAALGGALALLFVLRPYWLLLAWASGAMFGVLLIGGQSVFGVLAYASLPAFGLVLGRRLIPAIRQHPWIGSWFVFIVVALAGLLWSPFEVYDNLRVYIGYFVTLAVSVLIVTELSTRQRERAFLAAILVPSTGVALIAWYQYFATEGGRLFQGVYRVFSIFAWANTLAFFLILPLGLAAHVIITSRARAARLLAGFSFAVMLGALVFTFGRGAWIGAAIAILFPIFMLATGRGRLLLVALVLSTTLAVWLSPPGVALRERVEDTANVEGRTYIWDNAIGRAFEEPLVGQGFRADEDYARGATNTLVQRGLHNTYLLVFFNHGAIGLVPFVVTWVLFAWETARGTLSAGPYGRRMRITALAAVAGVLTYLLSSNDLVNFAPSLYLWMVAAWASSPAARLDEAAHPVAETARGTAAAGVRAAPLPRLGRSSRV